MFQELKLKVGSLFLAASFLAPSAVFATSINEFERKSGPQQTDFIQTSVNTVADKVAVKNPALAQKIKDYFFVAPTSGNGASEGLNNFFAELKAYELRASRGQANLDEVQVESIIMDVIKEKIREACSC